MAKTEKGHENRVIVLFWKRVIYWF